MAKGNQHRPEARLRLCCEVVWEKRLIGRHDSSWFQSFSYFEFRAASLRLGAAL